MIAQVDRIGQGIMYSATAKNILYPIGEALLGTHMLRYLEILDETQWWAPAKLRELQNEKLRALIKHAYKNVPYYQRILRERGLTDNDVQTVEDLQKLPILTKDLIREHFLDLTSRDIEGRRVLLNATSGSTGEPLRYYLDMDVTSMGWASTFRAWGWAGYRLGDKRATLAGSSLVPGSPPSLRERLRGMAERNLKLSAFGMSERTMGLYARKLAKHRPRFLRGYPSALYLFACYLEAASINTIKPDAVFTTAEMLLPQHRQTIEREFECIVFDNYGCNDGGQMHVNAVSIMDTTLLWRSSLWSSHAMVNLLLPMKAVR